jgi:hypothetical protein
MLAVNLSTKRTISDNAMHVTNSDAFVLRMRFLFMTIMVKVLPMQPNMSKASKVTSPKSHERGANGRTPLLIAVRVTLLSI